MKTSRARAASWPVFLLLAACSTSEPTAPTDTGGSNCTVASEGCECTAHGVCDPGLTCLSKLCVRVPDGGAAGSGGSAGQGGSSGLGGNSGTGGSGVGGQPAGGSGGCSPDCAGKKCGDDGCNGTCGSCDTGFDCASGACVAPNCSKDPSSYACQSGESRCQYDTPADWEKAQGERCTAVGTSCPTWQPICATTEYCVAQAGQAPKCCPSVLPSPHSGEPAGELDAPCGTINGCKVGCKNPFCCVSGVCVNRTFMSSHCLTDSDCQPVLGASRRCADGLCTALCNGTTCPIPGGKWECSAPVQFDIGSYRVCQPAFGTPFHCVPLEETTGAPFDPGYCDGSNAGSTSYVCHGGSTCSGYPAYVCY
jgi:hypothetical protein